MFSASKLYQSVSICGPSATAKPISAKIAMTSSVTWLTGWTVPLRRAAERPGSVTSSHSRAQALVQRGIGQRRLARGEAPS